MAKVIEKTEKYVVIKGHTLGHKVGAKIDLTEQKAKSLVGKVRLASEKVDDDEFAAEVGRLKTSNNELKTENEALKLEVKALTAENTLLKPKE